NAKSHDVENLNTHSNIRTHFLPPNTISYLQPIDQGIIYSLKANYRRLLCQDRIEAYDALTPENLMPSPLTIRNAIKFSAAAWNSVTETTIRNSWQRAGILPVDDNDNNYEFVDFTVGHTETEGELTNLIFQMPQVSDPLSAMEYIQIDNQVASEEQMTDEEI
ncbi:12480_t:CDS:2, partial [Ambispora gerdemannii]